MHPKPEVPGDVFVTKENDLTPNIDKTRLVGYTVSASSNFIVHFNKFHKFTTVRFSGMDGYVMLAFIHTICNFDY